MKGVFYSRDASSNQAPRKVYNWRIYAPACSASMGSVMFGCDSAFIGGASTLPSFQKRFGLVSAQGTKPADLEANIVSAFQAGAFSGATLMYPVTESFGRRLTPLLCGLSFNLCAITQVASSGHIGAIYAGRILTGLAVGAFLLDHPGFTSLNLHLLPSEAASLAFSNASSRFP